MRWESATGLLCNNPAGAEVSNLMRLKGPEAENARLKRMYSDLALENAAIKNLFRFRNHSTARSFLGWMA